MDSVKLKNINFWTINVPGIDNQVVRSTAGTLDFYKKVDEVRYRQEPYLNNFFNQILEARVASLEIGCGLGSDLRTFATRGVKVVGLDYSPENTYLCQRGLEVSGLEGRVFCGDAEYLPFPNDSFDLVYSWGCLHHTPNTQRSINEIMRVLRSGGKVMIMLYHKGYQFWYILTKYILSCKWIDKHFSLQTFINIQYDQTPLSQMFSKRQLYKMFRDFNEVDIKIENFGGIQFHPILKYIWRIFKKFPFLKQKFGSFAIIFAQKSGNCIKIKASPQVCCPLCHSEFDYYVDSVKCSNPMCGIRFEYYKEKIPILHINI